MVPEIALYRPQIPQNTGNIGRLCVGFNSRLHLIGELGFSLENKYLKRAGLDYWEKVLYTKYEVFDQFYEENLKKGREIICFTKLGEENIVSSSIGKNAILLFGQEQHGFPDHLIKRYQLRTVFIKIQGPIRSYNLSNAVSMAIYESYRKNKLI